MAKQTNTNILSTFRKKSNLSKDEALAFFEAFQSVLEKGLEQDKVVKINGLGTFKLTLVEARQSVDVTTKERIEIASHYKVTFTPDATLKERINQPLAHLETAELDDNIDASDAKPVSNDIVELENPMQKLVDQAIELKEILLDIQGAPEPVENVEVISESSSEPTDSIHNAETATILNESTSTAQNTEDKGIDEINLISGRDLIQEINIENGKEKNGKTWIWILVAVLLFLAIIALLLYQNRDFFVPKKPIPPQTESITKKLNLTVVNPFETESETVSSSVSEENLVQNLQVTDGDVSEAEAIESQSPKFSDIFTRERTYTEFIDTVVLPEGTRLTWLSLKQYGHKDFWVYIYEANTDVISNPNQVRSGIRLRIPKLDPQLVDASNPKCIEYARYLHDLYVK